MPATYEVTLDLHDDGKGKFYIMDESEQVAEMVIKVSGGNLTVYHTEVAAEQEGKGLAKKLLDAMADYARKNNLKVIPLCQFVLNQFTRRPEEFEDIWKKEK